MTLHAHGDRVDRERRSRDRPSAISSAVARRAKEEVPAAGRTTAGKIADLAWLHGLTSVATCPQFRASGYSVLRRSRGAFTLIEFILVMALLATLLAFVAPSLSRSIRGRGLEDEASRLVALTEYGRDEAVGTGVPFVVWIDAQTSRYGLEPRAGFPLRTARREEFELREDLQFDLGLAVDSGGPQTMAEFAADGTLETHSLESLWLVHRSGTRLGIVQMTNGWGYEILRESEYVERGRQPNF